MHNQTEVIARKLLSVAHELHTTGRTGASTGERIAGAFIINDMQYLPAGYTVLEAWDRLEPGWQRITLALHKAYYGQRFR
jgi:hypothetical protein